MSNSGAGYDFPVDVEAKITELRTKIREADHAYYVEANPVLGDAAYDRLLAELGKSLVRRSVALGLIFQQEPASPPGE